MNLLPNWLSFDLSLRDIVTMIHNSSQQQGVIPLAIKSFVVKRNFLGSSEDRITLQAEQMASMIFEAEEGKEISKSSLCIPFNFTVSQLFRYYCDRIKLLQTT